MYDDLKKERHELLQRVEQIDRELEKRRRPEWLRTGSQLPFSQWAEHEEIEPLSSEADAAFDAWTASRTLYDRHLSDEERINMEMDYQHEGWEGALILEYPENDEEPRDLLRDEIMTFSRWAVSPRSYHYPAKDRVPCILSMHGKFLVNAATERYLAFQARYWDAPPTERPEFDDFLHVRLTYGNQTLRKVLQRAKVSALDGGYLKRYKNGEDVGAQFNIWFRDWYNDSDGL